MIKGENHYPFCTTPSIQSSVVPLIRRLDQEDDDEIRNNHNNNNNNGREGISVIEKEHMFDKVVTPSDVGKLNRLVIPKQHAQKYFPLDFSATETNKGLLLNFEDRNGKPWRFRYSYWNSSQSYVITKGWSRFVKEKQLDAGDVVSFQRGRGESSLDRLFIDWRHRQPRPTNYDGIIFSNQKSAASVFNVNRGVPPQELWFDGSCLWPNPNMPRVNKCGNITSSNQTANNGYGYGYGYGNYSTFYGGGGGGGTGVDNDKRVVLESVPVVVRAEKKKKKVELKSLRLFGVNVDCPMSEEESEECAIILPSSAGSDEQLHDLHHYQIPSSSLPPQISQFRLYDDGVQHLGSTDQSLLEEIKGTSSKFL